MKVDCDGYVDQSYIENNLTQIESNKVSVVGVGLITTYRLLIKNLGKEIHRRRLVFNGKTLQQYYFNYRGNPVCYDMVNSKFRLIYIQFINDSIRVKFGNMILDINTDFDSFVNRYKRAFCNGIYFEQSNRYEIYFGGDMFDEVYVLKIINNKIREIFVNWHSN